MNTVRLRRQDQPYEAFDGPGRDLLLDALRKRMDLDTLIPDPRARDRLVTASGGAIRDLLSLVVDAALITDNNQLTLADVEYAVQRKKQRLRDLINANNWWGTLAAIAREKQLVRDDACLTVLYHRLVLKYNGTGWYDVVPIVAELPEFQHAYKQLPAKP
jgi:DNA polymerase III gamma/tau subunit